MKQRTNIQIEHKTLNRLKRHKHNPRETYDQLINRLIDNSSYNPEAE